MLGGGSELGGGSMLGGGSELGDSSMLGTFPSILLFLHGNGNSARRKELNILLETPLVVGMFLGVFAASCGVPLHRCHQVSSIPQGIFQPPT